MDSMSRHSLIAGAVVSALEFLATAWTRAWGALCLAGVIMAAAWVLWATDPHWRPLASAVMLGAALLAEGALYRLALGQRGAGPAGLGLGLLEARIGAVWALTVLFLFVLGLLAFVVVLAFAFAVATSGHGFVMALPATWAPAVDGRGRAVVAVVGSLCLAGLVWAGVRVSLGSAASVARGRILVLATWPATRGLVLVIILGRLALGAVPIGVAVAVLWASIAWAGASPVALWAAGLAAGAAIAGLWLPASVGLMAHLYARAPIPVAPGAPS
jgi:hypothetical protein